MKTADFSPPLEMDEKMLVFVPEKEPKSIWGGHCCVATYFQGKYNLDNDPAEIKTGLNMPETDSVSAIGEHGGI